MNIAVFCSSSNALDKTFYSLAENFGKSLALHKHTLIFGGANVGMMKTMALAAKKYSAKIIGIIPEFFAEKNLTCSALDQTIFVSSMAERKQKIISLADAFVALPGGFGTLDELSEVIVLKQIAQISNPIVILNHNGFYDFLLKQFDLFFEQNFAKAQYKNIIFSTDSIPELFNYLDNYSPCIDTNWHKVDKSDFSPQK